MRAVIIPRNPPVGYGFRPTDEELVDHYLKLKVLGITGDVCIIPEVDICKWDPWELPKIFEEQSIIPPDDKVHEWWFFYLQTPRIQRSTPLGYWKKTGVDRTIKAGDRNRAIGTKKTLVFYKRHGSEGVKTNWVIHEYYLLTNNLNELFPHAPTKSYVVCHLKHKGNEESDFSALQLNGGGISLMDLDSGLRQPEQNNSFPEPWSEAVGNYSISLADLDSNLHQPEHENLFPEPWIQAVENPSISLVDLQSDRQPEPENSCPESWILVDSATEPSLQQDNQVQVITSILPQTSFQSEIDSQTDLHVRNFGSPSFADLPWDDGVVVYIDESNQLQVGYIDRDQIQTQYGPECSSDDEHAVLMKSQQAQMIKSLHGVVSLDEKKGFIEHKFNGLHISSQKHMEPPKKPEIARTYSTDEESRVEKVEKLELAARNIKPECVTLDELEAKAKYGQTSSSCNAHAMVENWQTPTIETLHGQTSSSQNKNAMEKTGQTLAIELPHGCREVPPEEKKSFDGNESNCSNVFPPKRMDPLEEPATVRIYSKGEKMRFLEVKKQELAAKNIKPNCALLDDLATKAKSHNEHVVPVDNVRIGTVEPLNGVAPLHKKKGFDKNKFDSLHVPSTKHTELLEKLRKEDLATRNSKSVYIPLDESIAIAKHDQASRFHKGSTLEENWLTSTNKSLDGVLKGKKGCTESELDEWEIVSAKQTEHPKKAGNAGISCKYKDPRLEKLKMPEFSAREISNQKVHLWLNQKPDQSHRGESNEHREETEPAREISISATPSAGSTSNHAKISANSSAFKITKRFMPW
ncbi:protein NTM1-like 9 isoform X1 [Eucalyptus grandis]|uniref:protein NTM1-like 9 isoform X1 n=1 Tax=Eucalyptus grandis TaxID=71139 RepID=UPI00192E9700|nr:protein NTM1-like 9 isoform X1 [Eucalyptus grandis]